MATAGNQMQRASKLSPPGSIRAGLARFYERGGWLHSKPDAVRRMKLKAKYKRGYEVRIALVSKQELAELRTLLRKAGFEPSKPFVKVNRIVQPIYGRIAVKRFMQIMRSKESAETFSVGR